MVIYLIKFLYKFTLNPLLDKIHQEAHYSFGNTDKNEETNKKCQKQVIRNRPEIDLFKTRRFFKLA